MELPYDPVIPLLGIYPEKHETLIWKYIFTTVFMFIEAFTVAKIWKQPKYKWVDEWIKKKKHHYGAFAPKNTTWL